MTDDDLPDYHPLDVSQRELVIGLGVEVKKLATNVENLGTSLTVRIDRHEMMLLGNDEKPGLFEKFRKVELLGKAAVWLLGLTFAGVLAQVGSVWWINTKEATERELQRLATQATLANSERTARAVEETRDATAELAQAATSSAKAAESAVKAPQKVIVQLPPNPPTVLTEPPKKKKGLFE